MFSPVLIPNQYTEVLGLIQNNKSVTGASCWRVEVRKARRPRRENERTVLKAFQQVSSKHGYQVLFDRNSIRVVLSFSKGEIGLTRSDHTRE